MKSLSLTSIMQMLSDTFEEFPDVRTGSNTRYAIRDAAVGAFSVFFTQSPSFLAYQRDMQRRQGRNNAASLFGVEEIPTDPHIRNLLDPVSPEYVEPCFWSLYEQMESEGVLGDHRGYLDTLVIALDGTYYHSSTQIGCDKCQTRQQGDQLHYFHSAITPVLVSPPHNHVFPLAPEFITPQDGDEKQDCERKAAKRWHPAGSRRNGHRFQPWQVTLLGDDLYANQPLWALMDVHQLNRILVCKPDSHPALYEEIALLEKLDAVSQVTFRQWNGRFTEQWRIRYVNQVPLRASEDTLYANWLEVAIYREDTGARIYFNTFITNFVLNESSVSPIIRTGRARWKVENENNNVLKNYGYHLEHNFGHGDLYLAALLVSLNLLAFLIHTILDQTFSLFAQIRQELGPRRIFFDDIRALTRYLFFKDWDTLLNFMATQLEILPAPD